MDKLGNRVTLQTACAVLSTKSDRHLMGHAHERITTLASSNKLEWWMPVFCCRRIDA
jgi:hypothetical protein